MWWWPSLVLLVGCLAKVPADDRDSDRIADGVDNCPDVANSDQSDLNRDGTGDACELCNSTDTTDSDGDGIPNACDGCDNTQPDDNGNGVPDVCEDAHDEDGDSIPDFRDNCPSVMNTDQLDDEEAAGADGVGNACDGDSTRDRQLFDGFTQPNQLWDIEGNGWHVGQDHATVPSTPAGAFRYAGSARGTFHVRTHVGVQPQGQVGIVVLDGGSMGNQARVTCMLEIGNPSRVVLDVDGMTDSVPYMGPPDADMMLTGETGPLAAGGAVFTCNVPGATGKVSRMALSTSVVWVTGLGTQQVVTSSGGDTSGTATFSYFDVVTNGS
jgi:hypothetical protein